MKKLIPSTGLITISLLIFALSATQSFAQKDNPSASNLNNFIYPEHPCKQKPEIPHKPKNILSNQSVEKYNRKISKYNIDVLAYNKNIKEYKACINLYIKNGNNDISIIRKNLNSALKEARSK